MEILHPASEEAGLRLDVYLTQALPELTRSAAARLVEAGQVLCNGRRPPKSYRVTGGEAIAVTLPDPVPLDAQPEDIPLDIVYEDGDIIVVNKRAGMVVHPAPGHSGGTLVNALRGQPQRRGRRGAAGDRPPHRPGHQRPDHRGEK